MLSYDVHFDAKPANEKEITATLQSLWQKHAIALVALTESGVMIASALLQGMRLTSLKDRSKMVDLTKIQRNRKRPH